MFDVLRRTETHHLLIERVGSCYTSIHQNALLCLNINVQIAIVPNAGMAAK